MLHLSDKGLRQLILVFTFSLILGGFAILSMGIYLIVMVVQGNFALPLVLFEGLQFAFSVKASSLGSYVLYSLLLELCLILGLLILFLVRSMLVSLEREKPSPKASPYPSNASDTCFSCLPMQSNFCCCLPSARIGETFPISFLSGFSCFPHKQFMHW